MNLDGDFGASVNAVQEGTVIIVEHGNGDCTVIAHRRASQTTMTLVLSVQDRETLVEKLRWRKE